jgi:hypothetical protein
MVKKVCFQNRLIVKEKHSELNSAINKIFLKNIIFLKGFLLNHAKKTAFVTKLEGFILRSKNIHIRMLEESQTVHTNNIRSLNA